MHAFWSRLEHRFQSTTAGRRIRTIAPRILVDSFTGFGAFVAGATLRGILKLAAPHRDPVTEIFQEFAGYVWSHGPLLTLTLLATVAAFGVYTRSRFYPLPQKAMTLWQAVSLAYVIYICMVYLLRSPDANLPRGVFLLSYLLTVMGTIATRWAKDAFEKSFTVVSNKIPAQRPIRKVLVVGGAGYIGSGLVRDLIQDGYRVRVLDSLIYGDEAIRDLNGHPSFELLRGDFRHITPVVKAVKGVDAVIHLGAIVGDPACAVNEEETLETNLAATRLLADVCRASNVSRVLFASTCSVYGAAEETVDERSWLNPVSLYAATKIDSEKVLLGAKGRDFHPVILRLATAFGWSHRPRFDLVVNVLTAKAAVENKIVIFNGKQWRPFIHVLDISRAFRACLTAPLDLVSGEIFNAGSNQMNYTLQELAEVMQSLQPGLAVEYVNNNDARDYRVSFDKIRNRLGFDCKTTLEAGIHEIQQELRAGKVDDYRHSRYSNLQLVQEMSRNGHDHADPEREEMELTVLRFAKEAHWLRAVVEGTSARW
jgi:nucleoside-diphosphate-sugar epimerase